LGIVVGRLRTHQDKKVADLAKDTVRKWKNDVGGTKKPEGTAASTASSATAGKGGATSPTKPNPGVPNGVVKTENPGSSNGASPAKAKAPRTAASDNIPKEITGDKTRDGSIALLYNSIALDRDERNSPMLLHI
jgi:transcription elongation factor S-II